MNSSKQSDLKTSTDKEFNQQSNKLGVIVEDLHVEDANEKELESDRVTLSALRKKDLPASPSEVSPQPLPDSAQSESQS